MTASVFFYTHISREEESSDCRGMSIQTWGGAGVSEASAVLRNNFYESNKK